MISLALRSLRAHGTSLYACFLSVFLGAATITAFGSLMDTGLADGVSDTDTESLVTMAAVIGSWGLVIVLFSVVSTLGVAVRQRATELSLLRTIGTTNRQVRALVRRETFVVSVIASLLAVVPGWLLGRWVLSLVKRADMVESSVEHRLSLVTVVAVAVAMVAVSLVAAGLAARRATAGSAQAALTGSTRERTHMGRVRITFGLLFLVAGLSLSVLTMTVGAESEDPYVPMMLGGQAAMSWSLGLALVSPWLLVGVATVLGGPVARLGVTGELAVLNARRRAVQLATTLMPIIILVGAGAGTLYLVAVQESARPAGPKDVEAQNVEMLNYVVIGMIAVFAAIMVINTIIAATQDRRRELAGQRLMGLTGTGVVGLVSAEGAILAVTGVLFGGVATLGSAIPFTIAKTDGWLPEDGPWLFLGVALVAAVVTLTTSVLAARRAIRTPAIEAVLAA